MANEAMNSRLTANNSSISSQSNRNGGYKLSVESVLLFIFKEIFALIPIWVWILILVLILVRFLLSPLVSLVLFIHNKICRGCCPCLNAMHRTVSVSQTRAELLEKMSHIKLGIWKNDDGSEIKYKPLPREKELMDKINYDIKHILV